MIALWPELLLDFWTSLQIWRYNDKSMMRLIRKS